MRLFDTHAHIGLINEDAIEQLIIAKEALQENVTAIVSISNNLNDFFQIYDNLISATHVYHSIGVSPSEVVNPGKDWVMRIEEGTKLDRIVAIGEIGLDYYHKYGDRDSQIELFIRQLEIAQKYDLPVVIHNREAGNDVLDILKEELPPKGGVLHCYSEDYEYAKKALNLNLYFSFAGNVTYRNARNLHETAKRIPIDKILIESEAPFMVPSAFRGKRNRPSYIIETAKHVAMLRDKPVEEMAEILYQNSQRFFGIE